MGLIDLIAGLSFVAGHIGLARLDRGLRDGIEIPIDQIQAHVTLLARNAQIVTLTNQVQQLRGQAGRLQKQKLNAQHAQLMVQAGQLQLQVQQLTTERQHLQLEEKRELRLAQENRITRLFVDVYEQAQTYRLQGQTLDFVVVTLAAFRLYRQVYNDLDDAQNRLKLSELRERLFVSVSEILANNTSREKLAQAYANSLRQPVEAVTEAQRAQADGQKLLGDGRMAETAALSWTDASAQAGTGIEKLQAVRQALTGARQNLAALIGAGEWREFFFPVQADQTGGMLTGVADQWRDWINAINTLAGQPLADIYRGMDQLPGQLEQTLKLIDVAVSESQTRQINYQLAEALARLGATLVEHRTLYLQYNQQFSPLMQGAKSTSGPGLLDGVFLLQEIQANLIASFGPLRAYLDVNRHGTDTRYQAEVVRRVATLGHGSRNVAAKWVPDAFALFSEVNTLNTAINRLTSSYLAQLRIAVSTEAGFQLVRSRVQELVGSAQLAELDRLAEQAPEHLLDRAMLALQTQPQKQASQRWRWVQHYLRLHPPVPGGPPANQPPVDMLQALPRFSGTESGKPLAELKLANSSGRSDRPWLLPVLVGTILTICLGVALFAAQGRSALAAASQSTSTARAEATGLAAAQLTLVARPTDTAVPTSTATSTPTPRPSRTPLPTATATNSPTGTVDPLFTPPSATPSETPSNTPTETQTSTLTPTPTITPTPTKTATRRPTSTPAPRFIALLGRIWAGVEVYYGAGSTKAYGFQVLGGSEACPSLPSGRGVYVRYPDGTQEWKDREYLVNSGIFFVLEGDPALDKLDWYEYSPCP